MDFLNKDENIKSNKNKNIEKEEEIYINLFQTLSSVRNNNNKDISGKSNSNQKAPVEK